MNINTNFLRNEAFGGSIETEHLLKVRKAINERWDRLGMTEGLEGHIKENIATLYENQAKLLLGESTSANSSGSFETVVFPLIRRVFSKLLANDVVSVQAMNLPIGRLYFMLPVTSERQWDNLDASGNLVDGSTGSHSAMMGYERAAKNRDGRGENRYQLPDEVINLSQVVPTPINPKVNPGTVPVNYNSGMYVPPVPTYQNWDPTQPKNKPMVTQYMRKTLYDLFYDDQLYDNSKGKIYIKVANGATPVTLDEKGVFTPVTGVYPFNSLDGTVRNVMLEVTGFSQYQAGRLTGPDGNEMDTEEFLASLKVMAGKTIGAPNDGFSSYVENEQVQFRIVTQRYGGGIVDYGANICDPNGKMYIEVDLTKPVTEQGKTIDGYIGVDPDYPFDAETFNVAWCQYDSLEMETEIGEVSFKLDFVVVSVTGRKLRASWSPEVAQDVNAFHNIDAEAELTALLSEQISAEIDREILRDLRKGAPWQRKWDVNGWRRQAAFSTNYTQKDWNQELMTCVNQISAQIHKATLRGGANFIVVSSEISALFDNLEYFHVSDASAESDMYNMGIERIGTLSSRYQCFRDPYSPHYSMIIGHKGTSLLDTGYIYAPYIPLQLTPTMPNPFNATPIKYISTRYAKKMVNNRYYGHVTVNGLVTWNTNEFR